MNDFEFYNSDADITLIIPRPPSVNTAFANTKTGRVKSKAYKQWIAEAKHALYEQPISKHIKGKIAIVYSLATPSLKRIRDCANYEKALSDLLVRLQIIEDDSLIISNTQRWIEEEGDHVICEIFSLES